MESRDPAFEGTRSGWAFVSRSICIWGGEEVLVAALVDRSLMRLELREGIGPLAIPQHRSDGFAVAIVSW